MTKHIKIALGGLLLITVLPIYVLFKPSSLRWQTPENCVEDLSQRFPNGTPYKEAEEWVHAQPFIGISSTVPYDMERGVGRVFARVYNGYGRPGAFGMNYMDISFWYDEFGRITHLSATSVSGAIHVFH